MPVTFVVDYEFGNPHGARAIAGTLVMDGSYATSGDTMNLANYFHNASTPTVVISAADGYMLEHNHGTANAGTVIARYSSVNTKNGANETIALVEVTATTNLATVNTTFVAFGKPSLTSQ
jgi:hypothetical protein